MEPRQERIAHAASTLRGKDRKTSGALDSFQKIVDLDVGVTVVAIIDLGAFAKKRVRFVEKKDCATRFCRIEDSTYILLRLADVFAHHVAQIDAVEVHPQPARQSLGGGERSRQAFASETFRCR